MNIAKTMLALIFGEELRFSHGERVGLKYSLELAIKNRKLTIAMILTGFVAALLEGSTIAILVLATEVLAGTYRLDFIQSIWFVGGPLHEFSMSADKNILFISIVVVGVSAQVGKSLFHYLSRSTAIRIGIRVARELQEIVTYKIMQLPYSQVITYQSGSLAEILKHSGTVPRQIVSTILNKSILSVFLLAIYLAAMVAISLELTVIALIVAVIVSITLNKVVGTLRDLGKTMTDTMMDGMRITIEFLGAPRLIRVFNAGEYAKEKINAVRKKMLKTQQDADLLRARVEPSIDAITIISVGGFLIVGYTLLGEQINQATTQLLVFLLILNRMMPQVKSINQCRLHFSNLRRSMAVVGEFLDQSDESDICTGNIELSGPIKEIRFDDVSFRYSKARSNAIDKLCLSVQGGTTVAFIGMSGSGKTTVFDLVLGLYQPSKGSILVNEFQVSDLERDSWLGRFGVVEQEIVLINATVRENISFARFGYTDDQIREAAVMANADSFIREMPQGYDTVVGERGYRMSGGQRQRLALARSLLSDPEIMIFDEATSSLDTESELKIQNTLKNLQGTRTILVAAHRLSTIIDADLVVVLQNGQIVEKGKPSELLATSSKLSNLWNQQAKRSNFAED